MTSRAERAAESLELRRHIAEVKKHGVGFCRAHSRVKPCEPCAITADKIRANWRDPEWRTKRQQAVARRTNSWSRAEERLFRELAGGMAVHEMVRVFAERGYARTVSALYIHAELNHIDVFRSGLTANELVKLFSIGYATIRAWVRRGYLTGHQYGRFWLYEDAEIEAFIRAEPWAFDLERMAPGKYQQLAALVKRRDPWLKLDDAARTLSCDPETVAKRIHTGEIDGRQRPGHHGQRLIRASSLPALRESIAAAVERRRAGLTLIPNAYARFARAPKTPCPGCGGPVPAPRRKWCSKQCLQRVWKRANRPERRAA